MTSVVNRNLAFIESMQFMNSSLDVLVKNLSNNDFKYLSQGFSGKIVKVGKTKGVYLCEYMKF